MTVARLDHHQWPHVGREPEVASCPVAPPDLPVGRGHPSPVWMGSRKISVRQNARAITRRTMIAAVTTALLGGGAGCMMDPSFPDVDALSGPDGKPVFEPAELTVSAGKTVIWGFPSSGHNVSCRPSDSDQVHLPETAEPFASYGPEESSQRSVVPRGETFEYTFDVEGRYEYVCIPHVNQDMSGEIYVQ